jgi:hypothetical protein
MLTAHHLTTIAHGVEATFAGQAFVLARSGSGVAKVDSAVISSQILAGIRNKAKISGPAVWT